MYSLRLVRSIEDHWEEIATDTLRRIQQDKGASHMAKLPDAEIRAWVGGILKIFHSWPGSCSDGKIAETCDEMGRRRFENSIPLQESVRCMHILKHQIFDFARNRGFAQSAVEIYAQEELEHQVGLLFDRLVYNVVRGYEEARAKAGRSAA